MCRLSFYIVKTEVWNNRGGKTVKITDSDSIKDSEGELIDGLIGELDWQVIESILKDKYNLSLHDDVEYKQGDLVVHGSRIAYKLDFDVRVTLSLIVGRDGECFDIKASGSQEEDDIPPVNPSPEDDAPLQAVPDAPSANILRKDLKINDEMASHIADMINEIND